MNNAVFALPRDFAVHSAKVGLERAYPLLPKREITIFAGLKL